MSGPVPHVDAPPSPVDITLPSTFSSSTISMSGPVPHGETEFSFDESNSITSSKLLAALTEIWSFTVNPLKLKPANNNTKSAFFIFVLLFLYLMQF